MPDPSGPSLPRRIASLGRLYLLSPSRGAQAARAQESFLPSLWLYILCTTAYLFFFWLKPWDFPDKNVAYAPETSELFYWFKVMLWQPPLEAAGIVFLMGMITWLGSGALVGRLAVSLAWIVFPIVLMAAYGQKGGMPKAVFGAASLLWIAPFYPLLKKAPGAQWKPLINFMLGINSVGLAVLIPMAAAVALNERSLFMAAQIAGGIWILGIGTLGLRALTGLRLPRIFMALLLSMLFQIAFAFTLHLLGASKELLKAMLYG